MKILYLIVARGGSKGVPGKNIRKISGISLVGYKAIAAKRSRYCSRLIISTESKEIQQNALQYGVEVLFTRPIELSTDTAKTEDVIFHTIEYFEKQEGKTFDALCLLQPSAPFSRPIDLDRAVNIMKEKNASLVVGVREVTVSSIFLGTMDSEGRITSIIDKLSSLQDLRRQDVIQEVTMNGTFFLIQWEYFKKVRHRYKDRLNSYGLIMPWQYSIEIDEPKDLAYAEFLVEKGYVDLSYWR